MTYFSFEFSYLGTLHERYVQLILMDWCEMRDVASRTTLTNAGLVRLVMHQIPTK